MTNTHEIPLKNTWRINRNLKSIAVRIDVDVLEKFVRLAKEKGFRQNVLIQRAMLLAIEEMEQLED